MIIAAVLFFSVFVAKSIMADRTWREPRKAERNTVEELKEPIEL
jgi:hypothetical protein